MGMHLDFADLLDLAAGRATDDAHARACAACRARLAEARRIVEAGREALRAPAPGKRAMRLAMAAFRRARAEPRGAFRLAFDSFLEALPALRATAASSRFLRFEGEATLELEVREGARGTELRGQVTPPGFAPEVTVTQGGRSRSASLDAQGVFLVRGLRPGGIEMRLGEHRVLVDL